VPAVRTLKSFALFGCAAALVSATVIDAWAQRTTGAVLGVVRDGSGAILAGVSVTATSPSLPVPSAATTSESGQYHFAALPPGTYDLRFVLIGFTTVDRRGVVVRVGTAVELDVEMSVSPIAENVVVTGDVPLINTTSAQAASRLDAEFLRAAPINRSYFELLRMGEGVNVGTSTAPVAFNIFGSGVNDN
jgi:hypothetical protein